MSRLKAIWRRIQSLWRSSRVQDEIAEEMAFHMEQRTAENIRRGMSPEAARQEARQRFGSVNTIREQGYAVRGAGWIESFFQDVAYGARVLRRKPGFTLTAMLTLALGIGANTAIFSVMEGVLFRPLPYPQAERLFVIHESLPEQDKTGVSGPDFDDLYAQQHSFDLLAETFPNFSLRWTGQGEPRNLKCAAVTQDILAVLGLQPIIGRFYRPEEYHLQNGPTVISAKFWKEQFAGDPHVIGRVLNIDGMPQTVIGVMPDAPDLFPDIDVWAHMVPEYEFMHWRQNKFFTAIGRLRPAVTPAQAEQELTAILQRAPGQSQMSVTLAPLKDELVGRVQTQLAIVMGAVLLVLVITCVNVMYLLLARMSGRASEIALRLSLGAGRLRILRQFVTENLLLVTVGSGLGLLLAFNLVQLVRRFNLGNLPRGQQIAIDAPVLAFTVVVTLVLSLALASASATVTGRINLHAVLKDGKAAAGRPRRFRALVVSEVCCAVVLLVAAGLLVRSFWLVQHVDPGFAPDHLLTAYLRTAGEEQSGAYFNQILDSISHAPGVQAAALSDCLPASRAATATLDFGDRPNDPARPASVDGCWISPEFFKSIGASLEQGRYFTERDDDHAAPVVIISKSLARAYWPAQDPLGKRIAVSYLGVGRSSSGSARFREIVGVVADVKQRALDLPANPVLYMPFQQDESRHVYAALNLFVRTSGDPRWASSTVRNLIHAVNPDQPVTYVRTMDEVLFATLSPRRFSLALLGSFAFLALLLTAIGVYGTIAYSLSQRTRELGVRSALGAGRNHLLRLIMWEGLVLIAFGIALGIGLSLVFTRAMSGMLFGISALDPATIITAGAVLVSIAAAACFIPAWRAAHVDPVEALRAE